MAGSSWMIGVTIVYILAMVILSWWVGKKTTSKRDLSYGIQTQNS